MTQREGGRCSPPGALAGISSALWSQSYTAGRSQGGPFAGAACCLYFSHGVQCPPKPLEPPMLRPIPASLCVPGLWVTTLQANPPPRPLPHQSGHRWG